MAALPWLLHGRAGAPARDERDPPTAGSGTARARAADDAEEFWERGAGDRHAAPRPAGADRRSPQRGLRADRRRAGADRGAVDTVERFQGQQRDVILASFALGDPDAIFDEDEFLLSLNRFNVLASRARAKLIVLVSQEIVDHLAGDLDTLHESRLLKLYANSFCRHGAPMQLGHLVHGAPRLVEGIYRYR